MSELTHVKGSCLCGQVKIEAASVSPDVGACHCDMCRNWGGGPLMAVDCGTDVTFTGQENIASYVSSEWAERGFCKLCGSHLFYKLSQTDQHIMPTGLFDDKSGFIFDHQVFIDEKPEYYHFGNKTDDMTGAEVFAKFAGAEE